MKELTNLNTGDIVYLMKWANTTLKNQTVDDIKAEGIEQLHVVNRMELPTGCEILIKEEGEYSLPYTISTRKGESCKLYIYLGQNAVRFFTTNLDTWKEDFKAAYAVKLQELKDDYESDMASYNKIFRVVTEEVHN